jgi:hypothetical protein
MKKPTDELVLIKTLGLTWYVKWFATVMVLIAVTCRSVDEIPRIYDILFSSVGTLGWLYVSLQWKDRALIILNAVMSFMLIVAFLRNVL